MRIIAVDTPEVAKFGKSGQPLGEVAKSYVVEQLLSKRVRITPFSRDQYGRIVAQVSYGLNDDVSSSLLRKGLASVYRGGGAVYGYHSKEWWEEGSGMGSDESSGAVQGQLVCLWQCRDRRRGLCEGRRCLLCGGARWVAPALHRTGLRSRRRMRHLRCRCWHRSAHW